jgi:1,4-dihydroxy-2-naphthoate octaprenyltransferase
VALTAGSPWRWLFLLSAPLFIRNGLVVQRSQHPAELDPMLKQLSLSTLLFVLLFGVGQLL